MKIIEKLMRKTALLFCLGIIGFTAALCACSENTNSEKTAEKAVDAMPAELKDTTVLNTEEENALSKIGAITDTTVQK